MTPPSVLETSIICMKQMPFDGAGEILMQNHAFYFKEQAETVREEGSLDAVTAEFYAALFAYRQAEHDRYLKDEGLPPVGEGDLPIAQKGRSAVLTAKFQEILMPGLAPLISLLSHHYPGLDFNFLQSAIKENHTVLHDLFNSLLGLDLSTMEQLANKYKMSAEETVFLIINWLNPFFVALREKYRDQAQGKISDLLCPFCGYYPDMGVISADKEGKRFLHCGLCENEWQYKRLACAVCGNEDPAKLEVLSPEEKGRYRIDLCRVCGGYIKTVLLDKFEEIDSCDLVVENILTTHLDAAALKAGLKRP